MLSVQFTSNNKIINPCAGLHLINVQMGLDMPGACGDPGAINVLTQVYVSTTVSNIQQAYQANLPIYSSEDCTSCASSGWYAIPLGPDKSLEASDAFQWENGKCVWASSSPCDGGTLVTVVFSTIKNLVCDDQGMSTEVYLDSTTFDSASGMYDTAYLEVIDEGVGSIAPSEQYWFKELGSSSSFIRRFNPNNNTFIENNACSVSEPTRYQLGVLASTSEMRVCERGSNQTIWADASNFNNATTMWTSETGTGRPADGYYTAAVSGPFPNKIFEFSNNLLTDTDVECEGSEAPE